MDIVVDVPPPQGWTVEQAEVMWRSASLLEAARVLDTPLRLRGRDVERRVAGLDWEALAAALTQAEALIVRWPMVRHQERVIAPTSAPRGREDEAATARALDAGRLAAATRSPLRIEHAVYSRSEIRPWRSASLASDLGRLLRAVDRATDDVDARRAASPLRQVRSLAAPSSSTGTARERPLSSWPPAAARLAWIARRALSRIESVGQEADRHVPVRRLWQLYEDWVAVEFLRRLIQVLGEPHLAKGRLLAGWAWDHARVELWSQREFTYAKPRLLCGEPWVSVNWGALRPDLVLAVRTTAGVRVCAIDAKAYRRLDQPSTVMNRSPSTCGDYVRFATGASECMSFATLSFRKRHSLAPTLHLPLNRPASTGAFA